MSVKSRETAAVRFAHLVHPTTSELDTLASTYQLDPNLFEVDLSIPRHQSTQNSELSLVLPWPMWNASRSRFEAAHMRMIITDRLLLIIDDGQIPAVEHLEDTLRNDQHSSFQASAWSLAGDVLASLAKDTERSVRGAHGQTGTARSVARLFEQLAQTLEDAFTSVHEATSDTNVHDVWQLVIHRLHHLARVAPAAAPRVAQSVVPMRGAPLHRLARVYAVSSVAIFILTIIAISSSK